MELENFEIFAYKRYASVAKYKGVNKVAIIPQTYRGVPITEIRANAFAGAGVVAVIIPSTLQTIGENAFANCRDLRYVGCTICDIDLTDPDILEDFLADFDEALPSLSVLPPSLQSVEANGFKGTALKQVEFEAASIELGDSAFEGCKSLKMAAFFNCDSISLGKRVFMDSAIARFYAPKVRFDTIPEYSFANCTNLISVMARINAVGNRSFYNCRQLKTLDTPKRLRSIGREAFAGCDQLEALGKPTKKEPAPADVVEYDSSSRQQEENLHKFEPEAELQHKRQTLVWTLQKILNNAKEAEAVNNTDEMASVFGKPLFGMNIDYRGVLPKIIPTRIKGTLRKEDGAFYFSILAPASLTEVGLNPIPDQSLTNIAPILNHIVKKHMTIALLGKQNRNVYSVYEILPVATTSSGKGISLEFFHEMVERIKKPIPKGVDLEAMVPPFTIRSEEEIDTFVSICGQRLPAWVVNAYHKNKEIVANSRDWSSSEERRHARRALELLVNIDWLPHTIDVPPVNEVRKLLDESFYGLEEVKVRIEEIVAQIRRTGTLPKYGILLHGPAGTGKTSIAKAIARILRMAIIQMDMSSLGESPDEISGSFRIYGNAKEGMLLEQMFRIRSSTAVLLVNELDKAGESKGGRSAADILLTILDKTGFYENFLEEVVPTDNFFYVGTCNDLSAISRPLRDRFMIIDVPAYAPVEKKAIFNDYVFPVTMEKANITEAQIGVDEEAVELLVSEYAVEPGARDLEQFAQRFVGDYCRNVEDGMLHTKRIYTTDDIKQLFGPGRAVVRNIAIHPGAVNGAYYHDGKANFFLIEASLVPGTGKFEVLGPLTKLQEEYCKVAYCCVRNTVNAATCDLSKCDVTIFVPQPIPEKMGNYLGAPCYAAICSKILNRNLALKDICFAGACDLYGSLYFDHNDMTPLLRSMKANGISTLYAPMGTTRLVDAKANADCSVMIVEAPDVTTLFSLAMKQSHCR